jgi:NAD-dependent DNA ligase
VYPRIKQKMNIPKEIKRISGFSDEELQEYFNTQPLDYLHSMRIYVRDVYDNTDKPTGLTDWQYDILVDTLQRRNPDYIMPVGSKVRSGKNRTKLPYWLGSMDKIKMDPEFQGMMLDEMKNILVEEEERLLNIKNDEDDEFRDIESRIDKIKQQISQLRFLDKWTSHNKGPYLIEDKLDGVSCLLTHKDGKIKLYTRGDGVIGANISYLAPYFDTIPKNIPEDINVRGELIMPTDVFNKKWSSKYANPRNLVAGRTGAKTVKKGIRDIQFIAYEIVGDNKMPKPIDQFKKLKDLGFTIVRHQVVKRITLQLLANTLVNLKKSSLCEIDGLIVQPDQPYFRNTSGNPSYSFAFKMRIGDNLVDAKVIKVHWGLSKWSLLKPRVEFEPVQLMGTTVRYASGKYAKFIYKNKIGPGAIVKLTKGGETIPDIIGIVKGANEPDMPKPPCEWKWNKSNIDIIGLNNCGEICIKILLNFLQMMSFKGFGLKRVQKLYGGGIDSILRVLTVTYQELIEVGFGKKTANILLSSIKQNLDAGMSLPKLLSASGVLGQHMGVKNITLLLEAYPNILTEQKYMTEEEIYKKVSSIRGFGNVLSETTAKNLKCAAKFAKSMSYITVFTTTKKVEEGPLKGYTVIITGTIPGYERKQAATLVEDAGGKFSNNIKKPKDDFKQIVVIAEKPGKNKVKDAKKYGLTTYTPNEFLKIIGKE